MKYLLLSALSFALPTYPIYAKSITDTRVQATVSHAHKSPTAMLLTFKLTAKPNYELNLAAPWNLRLDSKDFTEAFTVAKLDYTIADIDPKLPGYSIEIRSKDANQSGKIAYKLEAYSCTADKAQCFKDTIQSQYSWPKKSKG